MGHLTSAKTRIAHGQVYALSAVIGLRPFFEGMLDAAGADQLARLLRAGAGIEGRRRITVITSAELPTRLRVTSIEAPEYEQSAAADYLRGDSVVVQGVAQKSVNLDLSQSGALALAERIEAVAAGAPRVGLRVRSRNRNLIELLPLTGDDAPKSADQSLSDIAATAGALLARSLPAEDFSDWEMSGEQQEPA